MDKKKYMIIIDYRKCVGCGACISVCPAKAGKIDLSRFGRNYICSIYSIKADAWHFTSIGFSLFGLTDHFFVKGITLLQDGFLFLFYSLSIFSALASLTAIANSLAASLISSTGGNDGAILILVSLGSFP